MFYKKKKSLANRDTANDIKLKAIEVEREEAIHTLRERTEKVIVCNGVVELYPEGADKERAKAQADAAKHSLLCAIGCYDGIVRRYKEIIALPDRNTTTYYGRTLKTSHEWIEYFYKSFYKTH